MQKAETWRLFIAITVPDPVKDEIEKAQAELRRALPDAAVRWSKRAQFHLTLRFLGDVEAQRVAALTESLRRACRGFPALRLRAEGVDFFPDQRRPRVVWAGVQDAEGILPKLQGAIESAIADFTLQKAEGKFTGHLTLGRCAGIRPAQAESLSRLALEMGQRRFGEWTADKVELIRSESLPGGARHTTLATAPLEDESTRARQGE